MSTYLRLFAKPNQLLKDQLMDSKPISCCKIKFYLLYIVHNYWQESLKQTDRKEEEKISKITLYNYFSLSLLSLTEEK